MRDEETIADYIRQACLMEVTARKPGNVHPEASFNDLTYEDLVRSAEVIAPILARARQRGLGRTILDAVVATRQNVGGNANLGIILLLAPLAAVQPETPLEKGIGPVLKQSTREDARLAYQAVRLANPGGMGRVSEQDILQEPTATLLEAMRLAARRDAVASEYATGFRLVLEVGVPVLAEAPIHGHTWEQAIIRLQLILMAGCPDTLILRKRGAEEAEESARRAGAVLAAGWPGARSGREKLVELDRWLREFGNARNPGTTADLVAASLFAALRDGQIAALRPEQLHKPVPASSPPNGKRQS